MKSFIKLIGLNLTVCCVLFFFANCNKNENPECRITSPDNGSVFEIGDVITFKAEASDPDGSITEVRFLAYTTNIGTVTSPPYEVEWNTTGKLAKSYKIIAEAVDNEDATTRAEIGITVNEFNNPPTAKIEVDKTTGDISTYFYFNSYNSADIEDSYDLETRWDFDGDGFWDKGWSNDKTASFKYSATGPFYAILEVRDSGGKTDKDQVSISIY